MDFDLTHTNGIKLPHLSASTISSFIGSRFGFYQSKVMNKPFEGNQFTSRGKAVEGAINHWIETGDDDDLIKVSLDMYDEELSKSGISAIAGQEVRDTIPGLVNLAHKVYAEEFSKNKAVTQHKITGRLEGVKRDIIGYLDFFQPAIAVRDSKVVSKTPSKLSQAYVIQGAFYRNATGLPVVFDFFIPNKTPVHKAIMLSDDEYLFGISYMTAAAKVIEEIEECSDASRMMELMSFPDLDSMYSAKDKEVAAKAWGIKL